VPFLRGLVSAPHEYAAHIVIADGGDGKSILCSQLVHDINTSCGTSGRRAVLLSVEALRDRLNDGMVPNLRITSLYDVYHIFGILSGDEAYGDRGRPDFEVQVFSGNLVIVLDGLDELVALFRDRFDIHSFLLSVQELSAQLGDSHIVMTSRGNVFRDASVSLQNLGLYALRGFGIAECTTYFNKRFRRKLPEAARQSAIMSSIRAIRKLIDQYNVERVPPFIVDLVALMNDREDMKAYDEDDDLETTYPSGLTPTLGTLCFWRR
jgi:hypothetical protein